MADAAQDEWLDVTLEHVVFHNPTNHYTVAKVVTDDGVELTAVGSLVGVSPGTPLRLHGQQVVDKKYGAQFRVSSFQPRTPQTLLGIERYLGSGLVPGIGPELAKRIVAHFGLETLAVIGKTPHRLKEVEGIGASRARQIAAAWESQREVQDVMVFLRGHGVSSAYAVRIYQRYGADAIAIVSKNPYRLALDIWGIGFRTADGIAQSLGIARDAPERLEAGLVHVLGTLAEDGHCHVPVEELLEATAKLLEVAPALVEPALERLEAAELVRIEDLGDRGPCAALTELHQAEVEAASSLAAIITTPMKPLPTTAIAAIDRFERETGLALASEQRRAVEAAGVDKCVVITGGPGVGKTTIIRAIVHLFRAAKRSMALAAPTGRAAKRLSESTGMEALTIHRLLEYQPHLHAFQRNAEHQLEADVIIVDEASMIDIGLFRALVEAIPRTAQLIIVGDVDQLPSVGPGSVLTDVIASEAATVVRLTEIFRQAAESHIVLNAHRVNRGELPDLTAPPGTEAERTDFYFVERADPIAARETIVELVTQRIPKRFGFDPLTDVQVLTPMHRGELGTQALNAALQDALNPGGKVAAKRGDREFRIGDRVMQVKNDYDKGVFNGDIGTLTTAISDEDRLLCDFGDGRVASYERNELDQLVHAYAISIHKSQGSEYPVVVVPIATQHYMMLQRNLLYTALTRGKKLVVLVGSTRAVTMAVGNDATRKRYTWLAERLREATSPAS